MRGIQNIIGFILVWGVLAVGTLGLALIPLAILLFFVFRGSDQRIGKAINKADETMMNGEKFEQVGLQHRAFALMNRRATLGITNSRIILIQRGFFGGFSMKDIQWKDLTDAKIEENVLPVLCGSNLSFDHSNAKVPKMLVFGIPSEVAGAIYRRAQFEEQAWEEKRRLREIEEVRAASGGVTVHAGIPNSAPVGSSFSSSSVLQEIQKAKELLDAGAISDAEFQEMKARILRHAV